MTETDETPGPPTDGDAALAAGPLSLRDRLEGFVRNPSLRISKIILGATVVFVAVLATIVIVSELAWPGA